MKRLKRKFPSKTYETVVVSNKKRKRLKSINCESCGKDWPAFFMIKDELWEQVADKDSLHCLSCFKEAIGRDLTKDDFKPEAELNETIFILFEQFEKQLKQIT